MVDDLILPAVFTMDEYAKLDDQDRAAVKRLSEADGQCGLDVFKIVTGVEHRWYYVYDRNAEGMLFVVDRSIPMDDWVVSFSVIRVRIGL